MAPDFNIKIVIIDAVNLGHKNQQIKLSILNNNKSEYGPSIQNLQYIYNKRKADKTTKNKKTESGTFVFTRLTKWSFRKSSSVYGQ